MNKNLNKKIALIIAVLVIFRLTASSGCRRVLQRQGAAWRAITKRIHLGLDLRGGAHLILQVVVSEAVSAETDNAVGRVQQDLKTANLTFTQVYKPDPQASRQ
jgi:preprotein translocase subunit SecD